MNFRISVALILVAVVVGGSIAPGFFCHSPAQTPISAPPGYEQSHYGVGDEARTIDIGTQPNAMTEFVTESLFHDRVLQGQLAASGWKLREHRYRSGKDMLPFSDGRLDVMVLGDIPALVAMSRGPVGVFALCRQGRDTIIARRQITASELKGLRVGYPPDSTAHFILRRTLLAVNLTISDIVSVALSPEQMESALRSQKVDAVVVWQPTASRLLAIAGHMAVAAADGYSYLVMDLNFAARHPELQRAVLAAVFRAAQWARLHDSNVRTELRWAREGANAFLGSSPFEVNDRWVRLVREETIDNASFPMLPLDSGDEMGALHQQFDFLKQSGSIAAWATWPTVKARLFFGVLPKVVGDPTWQTDRFDYALEKLYQEGETP